ncbi:MAG: PVC-type heme-binding CxxCH protein [Acidobacteriota bacterium]
MSFPAARVSVVRSVTHLLSSLLLLVLTLAGCRRQEGPPFSPDESLRQIRVEQGLRAELFASEPDISDPVAMEIDEDGRIYVVELHGYPLDTGPSGKIKLLEDTNGDGRPDRSTIFADGLVLPNSVMRWKKGILVTAAPDVWYFEDTDHDGKADVRKVILTGFSFSNPQHTVNSPVYGLDNWIYLAHSGPSRAVIYTQFSDPGKPIRFPDHPETTPQDVGDRGVRFRPDSFALETLSGESQYGHTFDEWGHYFTLDNSNHGRHEVIAARYLKRNPDLLVSRSMQDVSDHGNAAKIYPINRNPRIEMLTEFGEFTSACSLTFYMGGAFPSTYNQSAFVAEPVHNLVHRDLYSRAGSTFVARRVQEGVEFLASTDSWFRPVNFYNGPDGALYLIDYYREIIEHPEWTSSEVQSSKDLYNGSDRGRIYRIVPDSGLAAAPPKLSQASDEKLIQQLAHPNIWWRRTAQRLLVDRGSAPVESLERLMGESPSALGRLHAMWTLEGLGRLQPGLIEKALSDPEPGIRINAIRLAEPRLAGEKRLVDSLFKLVVDPDPGVRFQLLCTLGFLESPRSRELQERLLAENIEDHWVRVAALSASPNRPWELYQAAVSGRSALTARDSEGSRALFRQVGAVIGTRQKSREVRQVLTTAVGNRGRSAWVTALVDGLASVTRQDQSNADGWKENQTLLLSLFEQASPSLRGSALTLLKAAGLPSGPATRRLLERCRVMVSNREAEPQARADALGLLVLNGVPEHIDLLESLVNPQEPEAVQIAAIRALGQIPGNPVGEFLLEKWRVLTGPIRSEAADALLQDPDRNDLTLAAIREERIQRWSLNFGQKRRLLMNRDEKVREQARVLFEEKPGDREQVIKSYQQSLQLSGDVVRGEQVFKQVCSKCHRLNGTGAEVGPDLGTVRNRPAAVLLSDILLPSQSIAQKFEAYVVERHSGGIEEGVLGAQTPTTVTLRKEEGKEVVIARADIKRMYVTNLSMMPADLDKQVNVQQMADLLAFILGGR